MTIHSSILHTEFPALGFCGAADHHDETWLDEIEETEAALKELNILDAEETLARR